MHLYHLKVHKDQAWELFEALGSSGSAQLLKAHPEEAQSQKIFGPHIRRCEDIYRKVK